MAVDPTNGHGVAVVRYVEVAGDPAVAEVAATVADDWQGKGLGRVLLAQLVARAREESYRALRATVLASNQRSVAMLLHAGFRPHSGGGAQREYELVLA